MADDTSTATLPPGSSQLLQAAAADAGSTNSLRGFRDRLKLKPLSIATPKDLPATLSPKSRDLFKSIQQNETIADYFVFQDEIYSGGAKGKVLIATQKSDGSEVVVKIRTKNTNRGAGDRNWRTIMTQVNGLHASAHVLGISHIYEDETSFYVVMPKCDGGEFFEFLATEAEIPESECKRIIREILRGVGHLHDNNLLHRDIKPENIMFNLTDGDPKSPKSVKLIDFDTCFDYQPGSPKSRRFVGTPGFIAPEALQGDICPQSDLWSIGVILYILMTGEMPWTASMSLEDGIVGSIGATKMYRGLKEEVIEWEQEPWPMFPLARDLCQKLMAFDVQDRLQDFKLALAHPWLEEVPYASERSTSHFSDEDSPLGMGRQLSAFSAAQASKESDPALSPLSPFSLAEAKKASKARFPGLASNEARDASGNLKVEKHRNEEPMPQQNLDAQATSPFACFCFLSKLFGK